MVNQNGIEQVVCDRRDGFGVDLLRLFKEKKDWDVDWFILSTESNKVVRTRASKMKMRCFQATDDKLSFVENYFKEKFPSNYSPFDGLVYIGNDLNDFHIMKKAGFSVAPRDAHKDIIQIASLIYDFDGGDGFVRAFIEDLILENGNYLDFI